MPDSRRLRQTAGRIEACSIRCSNRTVLACAQGDDCVDTPCAHTLALVFSVYTNWSSEVGEVSANNICGREPGCLLAAMVSVAKPPITLIDLRRRPEVRTVRTHWSRPSCASAEGIVGGQNGTGRGARHAVKSSIKLRPIPSASAACYEREVSPGRHQGRKMDLLKLQASGTDR
jgi:hypothetical protein